jgi:hypothetical protein
LHKITGIISPNYRDKQLFNIPFNRLSLSSLLLFPCSQSFNSILRDLIQNSATCMLALVYNPAFWVKLKLREGPVKGCLENWAWKPRRRG